jgi:hypothetical protein
LETRPVRPIRAAAGASPLDLTDTGFDDDITVLASPSEPAAEPHPELAADDDAIEELDLGPLDEHLLAELAIALL